MKSYRWITLLISGWVAEAPGFFFDINLVSYQDRNSVSPVILSFVPFISIVYLLVSRIIIVKMNFWNSYMHTCIKFVVGYYTVTHFSFFNKFWSQGDEDGEIQTSDLQFMRHDPTQSCYHWDSKPLLFPHILLLYQTTENYPFILSFQPNIHDGTWIFFRLIFLSSHFFYFSNKWSLNVITPTFSYL